ncbi:MAG: VWA domain-containing protein [Firmicutes bacterium]|nr:VWA domain-containing protein [Bacillota bacterium]
MSSSSIQFNSNPWASPWWLLALIPAVLLTLIPFFRIKKQYRYTRNRVVSLIIRSVILILAVLLLSGMTFSSTKDNRKTDVVIVIDASYSVSGEGRGNTHADAIEKLIENVIRQGGGAYNIAIVTFGYTHRVAVPFGTRDSQILDRYKNAPPPDDTTATDIGMALNAAYNLLPNPNTGRIILVSDGLETDGDAEVVAGLIAANGVNVDVMHLTPASFENEVQLTNLSWPDVEERNQRIEIGVNTRVRVSIWRSGTDARSATLRLYNGPDLITDVNGRTEHTLFLSEPITHEEITIQFSGSGLQRIMAQITPHGDTIAQNNIFYSYVNIQGEGAILILQGQSGVMGSNGTRLRNLLTTFDPATQRIYENVDIENISSFAPTATLSDLQQYEQVILMNVANRDMPPAFVELLDFYVRQCGGGLLTVGGANAYDQADMKEDGEPTLFEDMLPVEADPSVEPLSLLIVFDASTSMAGGGQQAGISPRPNFDGTLPSRLSHAKDAIYAAAEAMKPQDYISIVRFSNLADTRIALNWTSVTDREAIELAVDGGRLPNGQFNHGTLQEQRGIWTSVGTAYNHAMVLAQQQMNIAQTPRRHIIFLTDGEPQDNPRTFRTTLANIHRNGTGPTLSAIGFGEVGAATVVDLAALGGGRHYNISNAAQLRDTMLAEVHAEIPQHTVDEVTPLALGDNLLAPIVLRNITQLPSVGGFYATTLKQGYEEDGRLPRARNAVRTAALGIPIYAEWSFGLGKVGSFMSVLDGSHWASDAYFTDVQAQTFIRNIIDSLMAPGSTDNPGLSVQYNPENQQSNRNYTTMISITGNIGDASDPITAAIVSPDSNVLPRQQIVLQRDGEDRISGFFTSTVPGIYRVEISRGGVAGFEMIEYFAFSYSSEFDAWTNQTKAISSYDFITGLATGPDPENPWGGLVLTPESDMFPQTREYIVDTYDPRLGFLIAAVVLFLLDIAARKFKFKWPHEWTRAARERAAAKEAGTG